jgi:hypothetical protein
VENFLEVKENAFIQTNINGKLHLTCIHYIEIFIITNSEGLGAIRPVHLDVEDATGLIK